MPEFIKKEDIVSAVTKLRDARKGRRCSRQATIEATAFEYCLAIINKVETYIFDESDRKL